MKIIVIPHAGGMASTYATFKKFEDGYLNFEIVELSGRGTRLTENLYDNFKEAVDDIYVSIQDSIRDEDYMLLGHSMGSWLAYELYYKIKEEGNTLPLHIFFSGNCSVFDKDPENKFSHLSDEEFMENVTKTGQASAEWFQNTELREIFLPILRSDFRMLENYEPEVGREPIACSITAMGGMQDQVVQNKLEGWSKVTSRESEILYYEGGHFYLFDEPSEIVDLIYRTIEIANNM